MKTTLYQDGDFLPTRDGDWIGETEQNQETGEKLQFFARTLSGLRVKAEKLRRNGRKIPPHAYKVIGGGPDSHTDYWANVI